MTITRCIAIIVCLLLPSCSKHRSLSQKNDDVAVDIGKKNLLDTIIKQEAMLIDIPIPLYDERIISSQELLESDVLVFGYKSSLSRAQAREFFMTQMERLGWQHLVSFETVELILQFSSPDRYCTVIIKNADQQSSSDIFIYIKKNN